MLLMVKVLNWKINLIILISLGSGDVDFYVKMG